jgi:hypothetical protein
MFSTVPVSAPASRKPAPTNPRWQFIPDPDNWAGRK